jgi:RNA polymerase sigma-70 factor (ECF subfamily)
MTKIDKTASAANYARPIVARMLRYMAPNDTEDVIQEARFRAHLRRKSFRGECAYSTWFTQIAVNLTLMRLRRKRPITHSLTDSEAAPFLNIQSDGPDPEREAIARDLVSKILIDLPSTQRFAITKRVEGFTMREIAHARGISLQCAKSHLFRARRTLKDRLQGLNQHRR